MEEKQEQLSETLSPAGVSPDDGTGSTTDAVADSRPPERPLPSEHIGTVGRETKISPEERETRTRALIPPEKPVTKMAEDVTLIKWTAWGALLISLLTSMLLGLYSARDFTPAFEYHDLERAQKKIVADVNTLKYRYSLETVENAIAQAQFQILVREDHDVAEKILEDAKISLQMLIDSLPIEKTAQPKQVLSLIDSVIRDVRRGPSKIDAKMATISKNLDMMSSPH